MFERGRPSRVRLLVATLAVVAAVSASSALILALPTASGDRAASDGGSSLATLSQSGSGYSAPASATKMVAAPVAPSTALLFGVEATVTLSADSRPIGVASDSANGNVFVTEAGLDNLVVINGSNQQILTGVVVGSNPSGVVYDAMHNEIFVANFYGDDVKVVAPETSDTWEVVATIAVPGAPVALAYDSSNGNVYVTQQWGNSTSEISAVTNKIVQTWNVGLYPDAAAFDPSASEIYIANAGSANVSILNTTTGLLTGSVPVGELPDAVAYDSGTGHVYVANFRSNNTTVISGDSVVTSFAVGDYPTGVTYNPTLSVIAVSAEGPNQINGGAGVVSFYTDATNALVNNVTVGSGTDGIAYNSVNGFEYAANGRSGNVSVLGTPQPAPYNVTFTETGLPSSTEWSVTFGTITTDSTTSTVTFSAQDGTYTFSVGTVAGYNATPAQGTVVVNGFPKSLSVVFAPVSYSVSFTESGLPAGAEWAVTLAGDTVTNTSATIAFSEVNGTYAYSVTSSTNLTASPAAGNVTVNGAPQSLTIKFSSGTSTSSTPASGTPWWEYVLVVVVVAAVVLGLVLVLRRRKPASTPPPSPSTPGGPGTPPAQ